MYLNSSVKKKGFNWHFSVTKSNLEQRTRDHDAMKAHMGELEEAVRTKDGMIGEQKRRLEEVKGNYRSQLAAVEDKYAAQKRIQVYQGILLKHICLV